MHETKTTIGRRTLLGGTIATLAAPALLLRVARAADEPIRIGFPTPLTGPFGAEAKDQVRCAELAIKQFNAAGGLKGRQVELLVRDDKLNRGEAATRTLELIEKDKVACIVGALSSSVQLAVNEVTKARGMLYVSISQSDTITAMPDFSRTTFHEALNPHMTAGAVARHVFKPGMKVAILLADYAYGQEMAAGFRSAAAAIGGIDIVLEQKHPFGAADYSTFLPRLRAAKADVVCICNFGRDQANSIKQAVDFGLKRQSKIVVPVLLYNQRLAGSPEAFEGIIGGSNYYWTIEDHVPTAKAFNDAYRADTSGGVPSDYGAYGYAGIRLVLDAMRRAGSVDADALVHQIENAKYDTYKGPETMRACDHQAVQSVLILQSKAKAAMKNATDLFDVLAMDDGSEANLRSCADLGHVAGK
ncbi:ABC transporter substrate-binding protein [Beijerinckia sp. L45]|uniref:ABC transporter substrate-binding protein n=1 Tax=Beijerinckia sp. L45 TaxID=1641855 RepID=UPI00131C5085|nr:ABC transporter substrate-binding protein [Beijerinckia sp. L45]